MKDLKDLKGLEKAVLIDKDNAVFRETINANTSFLWRQGKATEM